MLTLEFWEDKTKKLNGGDCYCCGIDDSKCDASLNTFYREANYTVAKEKMLNNLMNLRDDIDNLIREENKKNTLEKNKN